LENSVALDEEFSLANWQPSAVTVALTAGVRQFSKILNWGLPTTVIKTAIQRQTIIKIAAISLVLLFIAFHVCRGL
jgi:hypothetical protein